MKGTIPVFKMRLAAILYTAEWSRRMVHRGVRSARGQFQIIGAIVLLVSVFVMNDIFGSERASDHSCHHDSMFEFTADYFVGSHDGSLQSHL